MSLRFAVVYEAQSDFQTATELADRILQDGIPWLQSESELLAGQREWIADSPDGRRLTWTGINKLAREAGVRSHGHFDGEPGCPDAAAARRAIDYLLLKIPDLKAIILVRDQDNEAERHAGLEQARSQDRSGVPIVVGLAIVERESWVLCGFEPRDEAETVRLSEIRQELGFDPRIRSHELTACKRNTEKRSPKRVLRVLSDGEHHRQRHCWQETSLNVLRERGGQNGLVSFLDDVRSKLAPLIGHVSGGSID